MAARPIIKPVTRAKLAPSDEANAAKPVNADAANVPLEPAEELAAAAAKTKKKKRPAEMFYRDSAKYACTICNERYFTKNEVTACFEKHDDYE